MLGVQIIDFDILKYFLPKGDTLTTLRPTRKFIINNINLIVIVLTITTNNWFEKSFWISNCIFIVHKVSRDCLDENPVLLDDHYNLCFFSAAFVCETYFLF